MKNLRAGRLDDVVTVAFEDKAGDTCHVLLRKFEGRWACPVQAYTKTTEAGYSAVFGLKNGWEPTKQMVKLAERILK